MTMVKESAVVRFFAALWAAVKIAWGESRASRCLEALGRGVGAAAGGSGICRFLRRDGAVTRSWAGSVSCRVFTGLINLPCALVKWIYGALQGLWDGSLVCRGISALGGGSALLMGLFMLVMLVAPHALWNNLYGVAGAVALCALFILGSAARERDRLELDRLGPHYLLFMAFVVYGLIGSLSPSMSLRYFLFHMAGFLIVLVTVSALHTPEQLQRMIVAAVLGMTAAALYGCYQGWQGVAVVASLQDMTVNAGMPGRVYSFFDNPNNFAEVLVMMIPFLPALMLNARTWRGRLLALAALAVGLGAIGMTYSRSSWIGLVLAMGIFITLQNWRFLPAFLVLGLCAVPLLPETILNRILTIGNMKDSSTRYRLAIYEATANLMRDYGIRGVGLDPNVMQQVFRIYPTLYDGNYPIHTHNNYLQMWGELGLLGGISFLAAILGQVKQGLKSYWRCTDRRVRNILGAALGAFCGILVVGFAEYTWFYPRNMFLYWFLFGVIAGCVKLGGAAQRQLRK